MTNYKNYLIAILTGLLVLMITTQPSIGAATSNSAKAIQYDRCLSFEARNPGGLYSSTLVSCAQYKP